MQLAVLDRDRTAPRANPADGDRHIVASGATGDWAGWDLNVALWTDGAWLRLPPRAGWRAWVEDEGRLVIFDGTTWVGTTATEQQNLSLLGLGTSADAANPFSAKLNAALWTALTVAEGGTGDLRYVMNKETAADTLSLLMQTGWSGRAELGLAGDDSFRVKVSADGVTWRDAIVVDAATGRLARNIEVSNSSPALLLHDASYAVQGESKVWIARAGDRTYFQTRTVDDAWVRHHAIFEPPNNDLPSATSVVTRQKGDARYITALGGVGSLNLAFNLSGAFVGPNEIIAGASLQKGYVATNGVPVGYGSTLPGSWQAISGCGASSLGLWKRTA